MRLAVYVSVLALLGVPAARPAQAVPVRGGLWNAMGPPGQGSSAGGGLRSVPVGPEDPARTPDGPADVAPVSSAGPPRSTGGSTRGSTPAAPLRVRGEDPGWRWPLSKVERPIRGFDPPAQRWLAGHRGVDLAAEPGERVLAAGPGRIGMADRIAGRGVVTVIHPDGLRTTYLPVYALVRPGDVVAAGRPIGVVEDGAAHCPISCLHWGLLLGDLYLDPLLLFGGGQVRLLPIWAVRGGG